VQEALPRLYGAAVEETGVSPVGRPEVDVTRLEDGVELVFTGRGRRPPRDRAAGLRQPGRHGRRGHRQRRRRRRAVDELRERFASLTPVERAAGTGDYLTLDLVATVDGEEVPGGTAAGLSYELGKDDLLDGLDAAVDGASAGDVRTFTTTLLAGEMEGQEAEVAVTVRAVNERTLPEADDAFATGAGFDDAAALRGDVRTRLERMKLLQQGVDARDKVLEVLLEQVDVPLPASVLEAEQEWRTEQTQAQLAQAGMTLDMYLESEGKGEEEFTEELREGAVKAVKAQLVLDAVADKEELGVTDAELTEQVVRRAQRAGVSPDQFAQQVVQSGQLAGLVSEVRRGKALATVMEAATITDTAGAVVDLEKLRDDAESGPADDVQTDDDGRPYHVHEDGSVHYLDGQ
jgi:trigger factor